MAEEAAHVAPTDIGVPRTERKRPNGPDDHLLNGHRSVTVAEILVGARDGRNREIKDIYHKRRKYAIYEAGDRVMIQFSDKEREADEQIASIASLFPVRDKLQYLITGARSKEFERHNCYRAQIAEAMRLGLEQQLEIAARTLQGALDNCMEIREARGRISYMALAGITAVFLAAALLIAAYSMGGTSQGLMMLASTGGALGALLSVSIAIRQRNVAVDGDWFANMLDGGLRILIGSISGAIIYLFLASGMLRGVIGDNGGISTEQAQQMNWHIVLLIGFAAGFVERMVPELLEKEQNPAQGKSNGEEVGQP